MAIPDFQSLMLPLLQIAEDGKEHSLADARQTLTSKFSLTEAELAETLPSGRQSKFANRVAWAKVFLHQAGLLLSPRRAHFQISPRGTEVLKSAVKRIDIEFLEQFPEFIAFRTKKTQPDTALGASVLQDVGPETSEEALEAAHARLRAGLASDLLSRVKSASSEFF